MQEKIGKDDQKGGPPTNATGAMAEIRSHLLHRLTVEYYTLKKQKKQKKQKH